MIGVMEELIKMYPNVKLLFIGNSENAYYQEFKKEYDKSPAKDHMQVVPYFEHKYMGEFLRRIVDIFTLPTLQEGCSNAVLEAIYCDKPMVLTNVGNAMDVSYLKTCKVVKAAYDNVVKTSNEQMIRISAHKDSANKQALVEAFSEIISHLSQYKEDARLTNQEKAVYETSHMIEQYVEIIQNITQRR
jgi:glycosyltransferase involved in cell wall biosynthesis